MLRSDLRNLLCCVTVMYWGSSEIAPRHTVQAVNRSVVLSRCFQQFVEGCPFIAPIQIKADALTQFVFLDLTAQPFFENVLVAREDCLHAQNHWPISCLSPLGQE